MLSQKHHLSKHLHMRKHFFSIELHRFSRLFHACMQVAGGRRRSLNAKPC